MLDASLLPLHNGHARLRRLRHDDAVAYAAGTADPDVQRYGHLPEPSYTPASVRTMIDGDVRAGLERGDLAVLAIARPETDEFAGSLVLFNLAEDRGEVGFWVHPDHRGGGMGSAALDLGAQFARRAGLARLTARTATGNAASRHVLTRAGFVETARAMGTAPSGHDLNLIHYERTT
ncbi:GNAT family N-acetyltransferase [Tomitella fengzijianii]|uniref:GNAT family N-acetyltransferase n=1 Tax=Tomitella fengzijianii TaxID=2597660 RepID=A0A516WYY5_9ACTN|nr:GNAT family N-acetyltransferase [Tomitella fengzijianii]QDQ96056.1 GNAT family N-acetyltransferase [Tomitella fengzijianii]